MVSALPRARIDLRPCSSKKFAGAANRSCSCSLNPKYRPIEMTPNIHILGVVVQIVIDEARLHECAKRRHGYAAGGTRRSERTQDLPLGHAGNLCLHAGAAHRRRRRTCVDFENLGKTGVKTAPDGYGRAASGRIDRSAHGSPCCEAPVSAAPHCEVADSAYHGLVLHLPTSTKQSPNAQAPDSARAITPNEASGWNAYDVWHNRIRLLPGPSFLLTTTSNGIGK
jgi:hypothetical protein